MLGNRKKELDTDCQGTGGALIYLTLLLSVGLCQHPRVQIGRLGDRVRWNECPFHFPGDQS